MKRSILVVVLSLVLVVAFCGNAVTESAPDGWMNPRYDDGDDHTWGGEQENDDGTPISLAGDPTVNTGFIPLDLFLRAINLKFVYPGQRECGTIYLGGFNIQPKAEGNAETTEQVVINSRGN